MKIASLMSFSWAWQRLRGRDAQTRNRRLGSTVFQNQPRKPMEKGLCVFNGKIDLRYEIPIEGLSAGVSMDYRLMNRRNKRIERQWDVWKQDPETLEIIYDGTFGGAGLGNYLQIWDRSYTLIRPKAELRFSRNFGDHSVDALVLGEYIEEFEQYFCPDCEPTCIYCGEKVDSCLCNSDNTERFE